MSGGLEGKSGITKGRGGFLRPPPADCISIHPHNLRPFSNALNRDIDPDVPLLEGHRDMYEQKIDALRQCMEAVYQQRFTFKGEERPSSGPMVKGKINVKEVAGHVAAVRAKSIEEGDIGVDVTVDSVGKGAEVVGVDADTIGRRRP